MAFLRLFACRSLRHSIHTQRRDIRTQPPAPGPKSRKRREFRTQEIRRRTRAVRTENRPPGAHPPKGRSIRRKGTSVRGACKGKMNPTIPAHPKNLGFRPFDKPWKVGPPRPRPKIVCPQWECSQENSHSCPPPKTQTSRNPLHVHAGSAAA